MPALDDHIDIILDTYFFYITTTDGWRKIQQAGITPDADGCISVLTMNDSQLAHRFANEYFDTDNFVVLRFNPCNCGIYPSTEEIIDAQIVRIPITIIGPNLIEKVQQLNAI
ncbi:MAG: hypothetical protein WCJ49_01425 [Deltaproteobacteria bacterium]